MKRLSVNAWVFLWLLSGCSGSEDPSVQRDAAPSVQPDAAPGQRDAAPGQRDAAPSVFAVRGVAYGVREPISMELVHDGGRELLSVVADGPFAFPVELSAGDSYAVTFVGQPACVLVGASGVVTTAGADIELACESVYLAALALSGAAAPPLTPDPSITEYNADVGLLQDVVSVTAAANDPDARVAVNGVEIASGAASAPIDLDLGENSIEVSVTAPGGGTRVYRVQVRRAIEIAQAAYGKASNTGAFDNFGESVALSGDTLAVGAWGEGSGATGVGGDQADNSATNSGAVYIFRRDGTSWTQEAYLKASNTGAADLFGIRVALSGDTLAVGANFEESSATGVGGDQADNSAPLSGAVYIFRRDGTNWAQEAYLKASNTRVGDYFGESVALSGDTLAVGAWAEDSSATGVGGDQADNSATNSGAVYIFRRDGTSWAQEAYLKASNTGERDYFGESVALSGDTLAVGAWGEESSATGVGGDQADNSASDSGAVYIFHRDGTNWAQQAYLKASNTGAGDLFGESVALSGDTLAVGAWGEGSGATGVGGDQANNSASQSGAVYIFRRDGTSWAQEAYLKASNTGERDYFGESVALSGDTLAVGARYEDSSATGVGGDQADNSAGASGAVYIFRRDGTSWAQQAYLKASNTGGGDVFGDSVALSGDTLAVGANGEASSATGVGGNQEDNSALVSGAVYIFR